MHVRKARRIASAIALVGIAGIAGCGGSDDGGSSEGGSASGGSAEKKVLGVAVPYTQGSFYTGMIHGVREEAKKLGYELIVQDAGGFTNPDKQLSQVQNLITQQVTAMLVGPIDPASLAPSIEQAKGQKIPVVGAGEPAPGNDSSVASSHCQIGQAMADGLKDMLPQGGTVAGLAGPPGANWSTTRWKCFKERATDMKVVAEKTSDDTADLGVSIGTDMLAREPSLNAIYTADDVLGQGAAKAVEQARRCKKTLVVTAVLGEQDKELLRSGCMSLVVAQQTVEIGRQAVQTADKLVRGEQVEPKIEIPTVNVTGENLDEIDLSTVESPAGS
ncbi:MAG: ribose transport system substrate-binding protein [Solirubrobacteraceae bacterium]|nr:ribose transport system substrate-binding protein [Solirubrobacteraceae bacterium]